MSLGAIEAFLGSLPTPTLPLQVVSASGMTDLNPTATVVVLAVSNRSLARQAKAQLMRFYPADHLVSVMQSEGSASAPRTLSLSGLQRASPLDEQTAIVVPPIRAEDAHASLVGLRHLVARLRGPDGCPWDRAQDHASLTRYTIEEAHEVVEAIQAGEPAQLCDELGDLLLQVLLHAQLAQEESLFDLNDVFANLSRKLIRRHPHVFGDGMASTAEEVLQNWEQLKDTEDKGLKTSVLEDLPRHLPALMVAEEIQKRVARHGFDWPSAQGARDKVAEEYEELSSADSPEAFERELGDVLFALSKLALAHGLSAEETLRRANVRFRQRFMKVEAALRQQGKPLSETGRDELLRLWEAVKDGERASRGPTDSRSRPA